MMNFSFAKYLVVVVLALGFVVSAATPAYAITSAQRVQLLKYQYCMARIGQDKTLCHL